MGVMPSCQSSLARATISFWFIIWENSALIVHSGLTVLMDLQSIWKIELRLLLFLQTLPKFKRNLRRAEDGNLRCCQDTEPPLSRIWGLRNPSADLSLVCRCFARRKMAGSFVLQ